MGERESRKGYLATIGCLGPRDSALRIFPIFIQELADGLGPFETNDDFARFWANEYCKVLTNAGGTGVKLGGFEKVEMVVVEKLSYG